MMPRKKKTMEKVKPKYKYALHKKPSSGIGSIFIKYEYSDTKPTFDNGFWFDKTNSEWAKYE